MSDVEERKLERRGFTGDSKAMSQVQDMRCDRGEHIWRPGEAPAAECGCPADPGIHGCHPPVCSHCGVPDGEQASGYDDSYVKEDEDEDVCGLCYEPGADKMALWTGGGVYWPGERRSETEFVHAECEREETERAHSELTEEQRRTCIESAWRP